MIEITSTAKRKTDILGRLDFIALDSLSASPINLVIFKILNTLNSRSDLTASNALYPPGNKKVR